MSTLKKMLTDAFKAPSARKDAYRKEREESKLLAAARGIEIEKMREGGFNVWPPKDLASADPYEGDHYANDWDDVVIMARVYASTK